MTGMSIWPNLITALVGVAGIGGSILSSRLTAKSQKENLMLSISENRNDTRVEDKRQVYASFMATLNEITMGAAAAYRMETDPIKRASAVREANIARGAVYSRLSTLELVAREEISSQARTLTDLAMEVLEQLAADIRPQNAPVIDEKEKELLMAMQEDLGIKPAGTVERSEAELPDHAQRQLPLTDTAPGACGLSVKLIFSVPDV